MKNLTQIEVRSLMQSLVDHAETFVSKIYSEKNYISDFGHDGVIKTPIGEVQIPHTQIEKLIAKKRTGYYGLIKSTLINPLIILPTWDKNNVEATTYIKTFIDKKKDIIYFTSLTRNKNGQYEVVSNFASKENQIKKILEKGYKNKLHSYEGITSVSLQDLGLAKNRKPLLVFIHIGIPFTFTNLKQKKQTTKPHKGKEITANKSIKASVNKAIEDLRTLPQYKSLSPMFLGMFYNDFKNTDKIERLKGALKAKVYEKFGGKFFDEIEFDDWRKPTVIETATINEAGKELVSKIDARLKTLKAKKSGTDLFPELAGVTDAVLIFINAFLATHDKTVTKEELIYIITTFQLAIKKGLVKAKHPLASIANATQTKLLNVINKLDAKQKIKIEISNKKQIENKILGLHGLGFWNVIAATVIGKAAEHLTHKHLTKTKPNNLSGIYEVEPIYKQFKNKGKEAIKFLLKVKKGDAQKALYRKDIGFIDIIWGENDPKTNVGFGLKHIIEKHGKEIKQLGFNVEDFIPLVVNTGIFTTSKDINRIILKGKMFQIVIDTKYKGKPKNFVLTAFDLRIKKGLLGINQNVDGINFSSAPLYTATKKPNFLSISTYAANAPKYKRPKRLVDGVNIQKKTKSNNLSGVMTVTDAINGTYDLIGLDGKYLKLIGEACKPTSFFIYGPGGSGKSTFTLLFSDYMAKKGNKMLYVAGEQFATPVFSKMLKRLEIQDNENFVIVKSIETLPLKGFDFIVIDSKDSLNFELNDFIALKKNNPHLSFVILSQATKDGGFTGSEKWRNEVDTLLYCENLIVHSNLDKNRWGGSAEFSILKMK